VSEHGNAQFDLSRPHVMTVLGPIAPASLGTTLHHEHVVCRPLDVGTDDPDLMLDDPALSLAEVENASRVGLRAIVDMSPVDYGRNEGDLLWIAERTSVHVIAITGHHKHKHAAPYVGDETIDEIAARNIRELTEGIDGTGVRAGAIKAGTSLNEITPVEERVLRAAARAHLVTGAPISTHTDRGTMALEQIAILRDEGVEPARVIVGHLDFALDERYLRRVLGTGAFASFDQISKSKYAPDESRAAMVKTLVDAGHANQLLLSGDLARKSYLVAYGGGPGWSYVVEQFPRLLMETGLDGPTVRALYVDNPARALSVRPRLNTGA
jgi:predicted metal-dependent phosphotriesterase family hydrolase